MLKGGVLANLAVAGFGHLVQVIRHGLKKIQYRPGLIDGCLAGTGLALEPGENTSGHRELTICIYERRHLSKAALVEVQLRLGCTYAGATETSCIPPEILRLAVIIIIDEACCQDRAREHNRACEQPQGRNGHTKITWSNVTQVSTGEPPGTRTSGLRVCCSAALAVPDRAGKYCDLPVRAASSQTGCRIVPAATGPYRGIRATMEQPPRLTGLDHCGRADWATSDGHLDHGWQRYSWFISVVSGVRRRAPSRFVIPAGNA